MMMMMIIIITLFVFQRLEGVCHHATKSGQNLQVQSSYGGMKLQPTCREDQHQGNVRQAFT